MSEKILIVDDEPDIVELLDYHLTKEGYKTKTTLNGKKALEVAKDFLPDLILLDLMMPEMDGIEACVEIRETPQLKGTLVALLTARAEDYSQIAGFVSGADDYITKPIKPRVLISRIKALLRRKDDQKSESVDNADLYIDTEKYVVFHKGTEVVLPKKEFELLALLFTKPGNVFTREIILNKVWGGDIIVGDRTIDVHIRKLREKLGDSYIKTVKGVGYKLKI